MFFRKSLVFPHIWFWSNDLSGKSKAFAFLSFFVLANVK